MPNPLPEPFPARLTALRERAGLSQSEIARRAGISRQAYRKLEDGTSIPSMDTLVKLAEALGISPRKFFAS